MTIDLAMTLANDMVWMALIIASPILLVALVVGLLISIFQVVTQIQEMTLTFVPKILAAVLTIFLLGQWMLVNLVNYTTELFTNIPSYF